MNEQQTVITQESSQNNLRLALFILAALLVAFLAAWPLIGQEGFLNTRGGGDSPFLLQRLQQLETAVRDGHFPVRWMPDANYGYGYPFFNYYAPLSIYIAAVFRFFGFSFVRSIELSQLAGFFMAALGMFLLSRRWFKSSWAGLLASIAYTVAPFHMVNIYVRGDSLAEFWAMAWYPWILLAVDSLFDWQESGIPFNRLVGLALAFGALVISHNISALIFTPFVLLYVLLRWLFLRKSRTQLPNSPAMKPPARAIFLVLLAAFLGLMLAAWFFVPALGEQNLAQLGPVTEGYFHFSNHFRGIDLVQPTVIFDYNPDGGNAFRLGLIQSILTILGVLTLLVMAFRYQRVSAVQAIFSLSMLIVATFMVTPLSKPLWEYLPLLPFTQFPWRFLSVQALAASLVIGSLALLPAHRVIAFVAAVLLVAGSLAGLQTDHLLLSDADITPERLAWYEWFTGNIGSTVSAEYLPPTVNPRPYTSPWLNIGEREQVRALEGDFLDAWPSEWQTDRQVWTITTAEAGATLLFPTMFWPGWQARMDGQIVPIEPSEGSGLIKVQLPPGEHQLILELTRTPVRLAAELISLVALAATIVLLFLAQRRNRRIFVFAILSVIFGAFILPFRDWREPSYAGNNQTWDFAQMGYLHHDPAGVSFDNGAVFNRYSYDRDVVSAGDSVQISLNITGADGQDVTLSLNTPAAAWPVFDEQAPVFATQTGTISNDQVQFDLQMPPNVPAGLVLPRVTLEGAQPLMPSGKTRGDLFLQPLALADSFLRDESTPLLDVQAKSVQLRQDRLLDVQLAWTTTKQLSQNYHVSLRLIDKGGAWIAQLDTQPGYGFLPSSGWQPGVHVDDWLAITLPEELPREASYTLTATLYESESSNAVLTRNLGMVNIVDGQLDFQPAEPAFELPENMTPLTAVFGDLIQLQGYELIPSEGSIQLTLYWQALADGESDFTRFIHLYDPKTEEIVAQIDSHPQNNSYPTGQWVSGEIVADAVMLEYDVAKSRSYQIAVGFYKPEGQSFSRLAVVNPENNMPFPADRVILPPIIGP